MDINGGRHTGRKNDVRWHLINVDANRDTLGQAYPSEMLTGSSS
jgi:hypothetical protein